jgi:hypothetical protein
VVSHRGASTAGRTRWAHALCVSDRPQYLVRLRLSAHIHHSSQRVSTLSCLCAFTHAPRGFHCSVQKAKAQTNIHVSHRRTLSLTSVLQHPSLRPAINPPPPTAISHHPQITNHTASRRGGPSIGHGRASRGTASRATACKALAHPTTNHLPLSCGAS